MTTPVATGSACGIATFAKAPGQTEVLQNNCRQMEIFVSNVCEGFERFGCPPKFMEDLLAFAHQAFQRVASQGKPGEVAAFAAEKFSPLAVPEDVAQAEANFNERDATLQTCEILMAKYSNSAFATRLDGRLRRFQNVIASAFPHDKPTASHLYNLVISLSPTHGLHTKVFKPIDGTPCLRGVTELEVYSVLATWDDSSPFLKLGGFKLCSNTTGVVQELYLEKGESDLHLLSVGGPTERRDYTYGQLLAWIQQLASACATLHAKGYIHRDIKPANCIWFGGDSVKLGDFDSAHYYREDKRPFSVTGTMHYMAPEQLQNSDAFGVKADVYGIGCTVHQLLTRLTPLKEVRAIALVDKPLLWPADDSSVWPFLADLKLSSWTDLDPSCRPDAAWIRDTAKTVFIGMTQEQRNTVVPCVHQECVPCGDDHACTSKWCLDADTRMGHQCTIVLRHLNSDNVSNGDE